jgi:putative ABC transport system permease protein
MLRHALRLIWNRRRTNRLVVVEIAAAFVVTFVLTATAVDLWSNYRRPLGFEYENIWSVAVTDSSAGMSFGFSGQESYSDTLDAVLAALRALPRTEAVEPVMATPFENFNWQSQYAGEGDLPMVALVNRMTAAGLDAIGVDVVAGRPFGVEDEGQSYRAVLVNRDFVETAFGDGEDPIGQRIDYVDPTFPLDVLTEEQRAEFTREIRIVGVVDTFRQWGEFTASGPYVINREEPRDRTGSRFSLLLKVAPGTDLSFEESVVETVQSVATGWTAAVTPWAQLRESSHSSTLLPIKIEWTVAAFFIALVVMGLIGVLWQDVIRRTQEIGLRRALGARASDVRRQIQVEMLLVGIAGILVGSVIAIQFPLLNLVGRIDWEAAVPGMTLAAAIILALVLLGALYPSWLASRRDPADALRYE